MKEIFYVVWFSCLGAAFIAAIVIGLGRGETVECQQWRSDAKTLPGFYLTQWQKQQCDHYQINIEAPVK